MFYACVSHAQAHAEIIDFTQFNTMFNVNVILDSTHIINTHTCITKTAKLIKVHDSIEGFNLCKDDRFL
jgi:hypothetical protein